ncbi:erbin isoform X1 [Latimeria chalumnae]|uniref:erbin isoform X1 n=1 Tax=Latimeria chalumnae TaxID=7897 RepID=UPI00313D9EC4
MTTKRNLFVRLVPCRCLRGEEEAVTALDYSHCSLEQVPKEIFTFEKTLEELYLDANQIEELPKQLFNCQSLHKLSLPDNDLNVLPGSIANLINLRELDVSKNGIQEFPENIKNCKVLSIVEASVNPISKLPDGFTQLLNLTQLYLNDAFLEFLPANFGRLTKLQILELRENQLKMLPKTMSRLTQLERLDLGSNEFTEVPEVLEQLTGLKEFWMDGNRLTRLPGFVGKLKQLMYLDVSKNNIEIVEDGVSDCESLQDLLLSSNGLQLLPESTGLLKKLTTLKVDENQLMYLPESIGGLVSLEELDCSFNEIEALPSSIGQFTYLQTFAADHNYLTQLPPEIGNWKNVTVLFLHSNKLESLPEEMGDMQKLKVINLSDNRLKNLPYSFTKLQQLTAMWLSDNQSKPLIPLQKEVDPETQKTVLTNYMFPQQPRAEDVLSVSDNESFNPSLWEEQRKQRAQVAFECDEDKDERESPSKEGHLKRYPTPYPEELKNMVKTAQTVVHRLKDDEVVEEHGSEEKNNEDQKVTVKAVGISTSENATEVPKSEGVELHAVGNCVIKPSEPDGKDGAEISQTTAPLKTFENAKAVVNHEDMLEDSEDISSDEEMKMAEMRPPLIEISINQPKVVALSKDKRDDSKDADSLLDETVPNSNQNNSNCSSPSRMSDSVSLNTESSQDTSLCTPEKEAKITRIPQIKQGDENLNKVKETTPFLQNRSGSDISPQVIFKTQEKVEAKREILRLTEYEFSVEENLALLEQAKDLKNLTEEEHRLDQINMNINKLAATDGVPLDAVKNSKNTLQEEMSRKALLNNSGKQTVEHLENGNQVPSPGPQSQVNGGFEEMPHSPRKVDPGKVLPESTEMPVSRSTEELSPQRSGPLGPVVKSHSITNMEPATLKLYDIVNDNGPLEQNSAVRAPVTSAQGQSIVRSRSATLLNDQPLQVFPGSCSSSDLVSCTKTAYAFDPILNPEAANFARGTVPCGAPTPSVPQYNVQYSSSALAKESLWPQRQFVPTEHGTLPPQRLQRSDSNDSSTYVKHSASMNFSNHNNTRPSLAYTMQQRMGPRQAEMWAVPPSDRHFPVGSRGTLQRQNSASSAASVTFGDNGHPRRVQVPEGDYLTYREIHTMGRGPPVILGHQRPLSARTYSIDGPNVPRPQSARPSTNEVPERTMSVSDFNYSRTSPSKRPNMRVKSEHSLLDPQGVGRVPHDWREQVLRHIEAKKLEKYPHGNSIGEPVPDDVFASGQQNYSSVSLGPKDIPPDTMKKVPLPNGQMCQPSRSQVNFSQVQHPPAQASVGRHPSREQLIDYLMLKVAHQPPYAQSQASPRLGQEFVQQEIRVRIEKNPELGFSISGGVGGRGNPFRPDDTGIFVTRVQPEGPASKLLQPGDKIVQANGYNFSNIDHSQAVSLLKTFLNTVDLVIVREVPA